MRKECVIRGQQIVSKLWNYCNLLRDDGLSYGDYVEQLTYLLFLKMADERTKPPYDEPSFVPADLNWNSLKRLDGEDLDRQYRHILEALGREHGILGVIYQKAQNKIEDPAKLSCLVKEIIMTHLSTTMEDGPR